MSDLNDLIPALKRTAAPPGEFDTLFPEATDEELVGYIADAVAECQLDGFLAKYEIDLLQETVEPDLTNDSGAVKVAGAMALLYASYRIVLNELRNVRNRVAYQAGSASMEEDRTASMLNEILRQLNARKQDLIEQARLGNLATDVYVHDMAFLKATFDNLYSEPFAFDPRGV